MEFEIETQKKNLFYGILVYAVGNVLTQIISLVLLRIITGSVSTSDYGYFNLIITIDNLITPLLTLQISDAAFQFIIRSNTAEEKKEYYSIGLIVLITGIVLTCILVFLFNRIVVLEYPFLVALYIVSTNIFVYNQKIVRSLGKNREYVLSNILKAIVYLVLQIILIKNYSMGVVGLFVSSIVSTLLGVILQSILVKSYKYFNFMAVKWRTFIEMFKFSAPLIPNTAIWWFQSSVNSILITFFISSSANGIYSAANKFAAVLNIIISVFSLAWQEIATKECGTSNYKTLVTETLNTYSKMLLCIVLIAIPILKILTPFFIVEDYLEAIQYIPFLLIGTAFSAYTGFFGQIITAQNRTIELLKTNFIASLINLLVVLTFIKIIGIWAVAISSVVYHGYEIIARYERCKDTISICVFEFKQTVYLLTACSISCVIYLFGNAILVYINLLCNIIAFIIINKKVFIQIIKNGIKKLT